MVIWCTLLAFGVGVTLVGLKSFSEMMSATEASEVFALVMQAVAFSGMGILLSGSSLQHLASIWG